MGRLAVRELGRDKSGAIVSVGAGGQWGKGRGREGFMEKGDVGVVCGGQEDTSEILVSVRPPADLGRWIGSPRFAQRSPVISRMH